MLPEGGHVSVLFSLRLRCTIMEQALMNSDRERRPSWSSSAIFQIWNNSSSGNCDCLKNSLEFWPVTNPS